VPYKNSTVAGIPGGQISSASITKALYLKQVHEQKSTPTLNNIVITKHLSQPSNEKEEADGDPSSCSPIKTRV